MARLSKTQDIFPSESKLQLEDKSESFRAHTRELVNINK